MLLFNTGLTVQTIFLNLLVMSFLFCSAIGVPMHDELSSLNVQDLLKNYDTPGCAVSITHNNAVIFEKAFGTKTVNHLEIDLVDTHTVFPIASLTKHFTAVAIGILVDQNKVAWDDPIIKHYKNLKLSDNFIEKHLTIKDCLCMTSGLGALPAGYSDNFTQLSTAELLALTAQLPFDFKQYGHFAYNNLLYVLLEQVIQEVSGTSLASFYEKYLFEPLEMQHTLATYNELLKTKNKAIGHQLIKNAVTAVPYENLDNIKAGAGLSSCAHDISKWLLMLTNHGKYLDKTIVSEESLKEITTPYVKLEPQDFLGDSKILHDIYFPDRTNLAYGFGFFVRDYQNIALCQTPGFADGMMATLAICPKLNLGIAVLSNLERPEFVHDALFKLLDAFIPSGQLTI